MIMTTRPHRVPASQLAEVTRRVDTDWIETVRRLPGFVSAYAVSLAGEQLTLVTAFVDQATAERANEASVAWVSQRLMDLDVVSGDSQEGEVVSHAGAD